MSRIARSTLIVAFFFGLEKALGFLGKILVNRQFGMSATLDAFYAANNIPDLLFALISGGVLAMALIPVLSEYLDHSGRSAMWDLFSRIANLVFLATAALSVLVAIFADQLGMHSDHASFMLDKIDFIGRLRCILAISFEGQVI